MGFTFEAMRMDDYPEMVALWQSIPTIGLNKEDEEEKIGAYLLRNPQQSFTCKEDGRIIGTILCGNDGRRAFIYHLAVLPACRRQGVARKLVCLALEKQKSLGMEKCAVFIMAENESGKSFWARLGFTAVREADTLAKNF